MTVETQYNVVKVNELREITVAQGVDELVINDLDSSPLETKKITAQNFALSIKDYILPIATDETLGGVKIGEGLTINPITGVLSNDVLVLDDLDDVIILNAEPGHVLRYNGNQWINQSEGGFTKIVAGNGLSGGGTTGEVVLHVNAGPGLSIELDAVKVNAHKGLQILNDFVEVVVNPGLTISGNAITLVTGAGVVVDQGQVTLSLGDGLNFLGQNVQVNASQNGFRFPSGVLTLHTGVGLNYQAERLIVELGDYLWYNNNAVDVKKATYQDVGVSKHAPLVNNVRDLRGTDAYTEDDVTPEFIDRLVSVPPGAVFHFAGHEVPDGYLFCNGQVVLQVTYPHLFAVIGTHYNTPETPAGAFAVPDLRDEFIRGATTVANTPAPGVRDRIVGSTESGKTEIHVHGLTTGALVAPGQWAQNMMMTPTRWGFTQIGTMPIMMGGGGGPDFFSEEYVQQQLNLPGLTGDRLDLPNYQAQGTRDFTGDNPVEIPEGFERIEFPLVGDSETYPLTNPTDDVDETRPRNMALLPCIKF